CIDALLSDFWKLDLSTDTWTPVPSMELNVANIGNVPIGRNDASIVHVGERVFIGFGTNFDDLWEFNPQNETWTYAGNYGIKAQFGIHTMTIGERVFIGLDKNDDFRFTSSINTAASSRAWFEFIPPDPGMTNGQLIEVQSLPDYSPRFRKLNFTFSMGDSGFLVGTNTNTANTYIWQYVPNQN
ncbi:MAG: hypothetical protein AAF242_15550, partial [Bacteroidota bacterium]